MVTLTEHAHDRIKERLGLPKKARVSAAQRAYDLGLDLGQVGSALHTFLIAKQHEHDCSNWSAFMPNTSGSSPTQR